MAAAWVVVAFILVAVALFIVTHLRPLTTEEVKHLSRKRRTRGIKEYFLFAPGEVAVDPNFKKRMSPAGKFYGFRYPLYEFPQIAAALLKYKKHEWVIVAFEKDRNVELVWLNKGFDRTCVQMYLPVETVTELSEEHGYSSVLMFHNHPNPNPNVFDCTRPSIQDLTSAEYYAMALNATGINLVEFVCERGRHYQYYQAPASTFLSIEGFVQEAGAKNGVSKWGNLVLHWERVR